MGTVREQGWRYRSSPVVRRQSITVALVSHEACTEEMEAFLRAHLAIARQFRFMAPEQTARSVAGLGLEVEVLATEALGGDLQAAAAVVAGRVDAVIFLHDPVAALPSEPSVATMLKVCDLKPIPMATNIATAEALIHYLDVVAHRNARVAPPGDDEMPVERVLVLATRPPMDPDPPTH